MKVKFGPLLKKELFSLLISPASYAALLLFFIGSAVNFFVVEQFFTIESGSSDLRFFFSIMPYLCILVIPSLTMNLWAAEHDFIDSIPYSSFHISLAKFLSSSLFFIGALLLSLIIPFCASFFADIDTAQLVSGFLVMVLCGLCYTALALCISLIFEHQIASFLVTSVILFIVNTIHLIPLYVPVSKYISSIIRFISFAWHFDAAGKGILDSRDVFFYLILITVFVTVTVFIKEKRKGKNYAPLTIFLSICACILFFITSSLYYIRMDTTKTKLFSVSKISGQLLNDAEEKIQLRYYVSDELSRLYPQVRDVKDFLRAFALKSSNVSLEIIDPDDENIEQTLSSLGVQSQQIQTVKGNETSFITVYSSIVIEYLNNFELIPFTLSAESLEFDLVSRITILLQGYRKTVYLIEGTELSLEKDYSYVIPWLEASGYSVSAAEESNIHFDDITSPLIVIGSNFNDSTIQKIENFIIDGGRAVFLVSGNNTEVYTDWSSHPIHNNSLQSMLSYWGFSIDQGLLMDIANYRITMQSSDGNSYDYINYPLWITILPHYVYEHPVTKGYSGLELYWASPLSVFSTEQSTISVLAESSPQSFIQKPFSVSTANSEEDDANEYVTDPYSLKNMSFSSLEKKSYPVLAVLEGTVPGYYSTLRSSYTKIAVIPDHYAVSNMVEYTNSAHNLDLLINTLLYLCDDEALLSLKNKKVSVYDVYKITDASVFSRTKNAVFISVFMAVPCAVLSIPLIVFIRRKKNV